MWVAVAVVRMAVCGVAAVMVSGGVPFLWVLSALAVPGPAVTAGSVVEPLRFVPQVG